MVDEKAYKDAEGAFWEGGAGGLWAAIEQFHDDGDMTVVPSNPAPAAPQVHEEPIEPLRRRVEAASLLLRELVPAFWTLEHLEAARPDMLAAFKALEQKP